MYDTIVIGNDLSSLIAASISSRYGKKTILLCEGDITNIYSEAGYTFNIDPFPWTGFGPKQTFLQLFSELDMPFTDKSHVLRLDPSLQIILPEHRIDLYNRKDFLIEEMEREFKENTKSIRKLHAAVSKSSNLITGFIRKNPFIRPKTVKDFFRFIGNIPIFIGNRSVLSKRLKETQNVPSLKRVFEAELLLLSNLCTNEVNPLSSAYILSLPWEGLFSHLGGKYIIMDALRRKFASCGGRFINNISIMRLNVKKDEIEIDIDAGESMSTIKGKNLIISTKWEKFKPMLLNDERFSKLAKKFESIEAVYHPFTLHMGVSDKGIPEKMASHVIVIGDEKFPVMDNNLIFLETSSTGDTGCAPPGKRVISATVFLKESPLRLSNDDLEGVSTGILENIEGFLPFLRENLDFRNVEKSIEMSRKYQEVVNQKFKINGNPLLGISILSNRTPVKNVFLTGGMLLAGLGFDGEVISGMNAAHHVVGGTAK